MKALAFVAALLLCACVSTPAQDRYAAYKLMVQEREATTALAVKGEIGRADAAYIQAQLNEARRALDAGAVDTATPILDAIKVKLDARRGTAE